MIVLFSQKNAFPQRILSPGSYEWWYFDATDISNTYTFVAIWYDGFPFSPYYLSRYNKWKKDHDPSKAPYSNDHIGFSLQVYEKGKEIFSLVKEKSGSDLIVSPNPLSISFETCSFRYEQNKVCLNISLEHPIRKKIFKGKFEFVPNFFPLSNTAHLASNKSDSNHAWVIIAPRCQVNGYFQLVSTNKNEELFVNFKGIGYHDKNFGRHPLHEDIKTWDWGRASVDNEEIVYMNITYKIGKPFQTLFVLREGKLEETISSFSFEKKRVRFHPFAGFYSTRVLLNGDNMSLNGHASHTIEKAPFYQRYTTKLSLTHNAQVTDGFVGVTESLTPQVLSSRIMHFFLKAKVWRESKKSFMFTSFQTAAYFFSFFHKKRRIIKKRIGKG